MPQTYIYYVRTYSCFPLPQNRRARRQVVSMYLTGTATGSKYLAGRLTGSTYLAGTVTGSKCLADTATGSKYLTCTATGIKYLTVAVTGNKYLTVAVTGRKYPDWVEKIMFSILITLSLCLPFSMVSAYGIQLK